MLPPLRQTNVYDNNKQVGSVPRDAEMSTEPPSLASVRNQDSKRRNIDLGRFKHSRKYS